MGFLDDLAHLPETVFNKVETRVEKLWNVGDAVIDKVPTLVDKVGSAAGGILDGIGGLGQLAGNPTFVLIALVGAFVVLPKLLK
jgi:hypothetical protein